MRTFFLRLTPPRRFLPRNYSIVFCILFFGLILSRNLNKRNVIPHRNKDVITNDPKWTQVPSFKVPGTPDGHGELYLFSAYFDVHNGSKIVRVFATVPNYYDKYETVTCYFMGEKKDFVHSTDGIVRSLSNRPTYPYRGGFVLCPLPTNIKKVESKIFYVSISNGTAGYPSSCPVPITRPPNPDDPTDHEFGLCLQPVYEYDQVFPFIQWVEFHRMMGVSHFTFYNISMGPKVSCALKTMLKPSCHTVLNGWGSAPMISDDMFFLYAQLMQLSECSFRYRGKAHYYLNVDLDEYLVPNFTLAENFVQLLINIGEKVGPNVIAEYQVKNVVFQEKTRNRAFDPYTLPQPPLEKKDLLIYSHVLKTHETLKYGDRSKYIADPLGAVEPRPHFVEGMLPGYATYKIPVEVAYLQHFNGKAHNKGFSLGRLLGLGDGEEMENVNGRRFAIASELLDNVQKSVAKVKKNCNL